MSYEPLTISCFEYIQLMLEWHKLETFLSSVIKKKMYTEVYTKYYKTFVRYRLFFTS